MAVALITYGGTSQRLYDDVRNEISRQKHALRRQGRDGTKPRHAAKGRHGTSCDAMSRNSASFDYVTGLTPYVKLMTATQYGTYRRPISCTVTTPSFINCISSSLLFFFLRYAFLRQAVLNGLSLKREPPNCRPEYVKRWDPGDARACLHVSFMCSCF